MSSYDPVLSILIREMSSLPDRDDWTDKKAHDWLKTDNLCYYNTLRSIANEIRNAIADEVATGMSYYGDSPNADLVGDCINLITHRTKQEEQ